MTAMKKFFVLAAASLLAAGSLNAKTADELRIYINPGHGSWGPNDRPCATIPYPNLEETGRPDTCGFYESNTNLWKGLKLGSVLQKMGVKSENIMYSRVKNGPYPYVSGAADAEKYNRSLSEICTEVEANNMDMFLSIHSNATTDGSSTNYPLYLYRGSDGDGGDSVATSRDIGKAMWPLFYTNEIDPQSAYSPTSMNIRGDISFYGSSSTRTDPNSGKRYTGYLGVLKHGTPGFLSEGYFHTYQPARHRALNKDYCYMEGVRYARGLCQYFGLTAEKTGYVVGTVKDMHEKIVNNLFKYAPKTNDQWLPINGAKVTLLKDGQAVQEYTVDNNYNGVFVFEGVEPGTYTLSITADGYKAITDDQNPALVVKANETTYTMPLLESENYVPPTVTYYNYNDPEQPSYLGLADQFNFQKDNGVAYEGIQGTVKRVLQRGDSAVVLTDNNGVPGLYLVNTGTKAMVKAISTEGLVAGTEGDLGFYSQLADIAFTADGKLVGCNSVQCQYSDSYVDAGYTRGTVQFYKWDNLDSAPVKWVSTQSSGNYFRATAGKTLAISGPSTDCNIVTTATTTGTSQSFRVVVLSVVDNQVASTMFCNKTIDASSNFTEVKIGSDMKLTVSPRNDHYFILDGSNIEPFEFELASANNVDCEVIGRLPEGTLDNAANGVSFFKYTKRALMVAPYTAKDQLGGFKLYDVTDGLDKAVLITTTGTDLDVHSPEGETPSFFMSGASLVDQADITTYLVKDNNITTFTTKNVEQPKVKAIFAYDLNSVKNGDDSYTFTFKANSDATNAALIFTDAASGEEIATVPVEAKEGENTVTLTPAQIPGNEGQDMNWAVNVVGKPITNIVRLNANDENFTYNSAFCAVDNSPESNYFGRLYVSNYVAKNNANNGLYVYNGDWTRINSTPMRGGIAMSTNYRIAVDGNGTVYIPDWSDPYSGVYVVNPADFTTFTQLFQGERASSGLFTNNGVQVGGSSPGVAATGYGANTTLYVYNEDMNNDVYAYKLGNADGTVATTWGVAPTKAYGIGAYQLNTNGNVVANEDGGIWVAQVRSAGNNAKGVPSLMYVDADGNIKFNSGDASWADNLNGSQGSGFAISPDGKTLVINDASGVLQFFNLEWNDGTPVLTPKYSYTADARTASKSIFQMAFDYAGNLVASGANVGIYSIPTTDNQATTPAKKALLVTKRTGTGVEDAVADVKVNVFPNPTVGTINIVSAEAIKTVKVYAMNGALVAEGNQAQLDLGNLSAGVYMVKVNDQQAVRIVKK